MSKTENSSTCSDADVANGAVPREELEYFLRLEDKSDRPDELLKTTRQIITEIFREPLVLLAACFALAITTGSALLEPRVLGWMVDQALVPKDWARLKYLGVMFFGLQITRLLGSGFQSYAFAVLGQKIMQRLRIRLIKKFLGLPMGVLHTWPVGKLVTRTTNDVAALADMFSEGIVSILANIFTVAGIIVMMVLLDLHLALVALLFLPPLIIGALYFSAKLRNAYRNSRARLSALNSFLSESLQGIRELRLLNLRPARRRRYVALNNWYGEAQFATTKLFGVFQPMITLTTGVTIALVIYFGAQRVTDAVIPVGVYVAFFAYVQGIFQPIREIADRWNVFLAGATAAERIFSALEWPSELGEMELAETDKPILGKIEFRNIWFAYNHENWVLKNISFTIEAGESVGLVGATGAGKSSIISLLLRFYEPQKGEILLDGKNLRLYPLRDLRRHFGLVQQEVYLFAGSTLENVTIGDDSRENRIKKPLRDLLPIERKITERGGNLSFGERQVISFARAVCANPSIWILDEATSSVDSSSEALMMRWLTEYSERKTSLLVAHRLSTVRNTDQILVLHRGELIEVGKHSELLSRRGIYYKLWSYQDGLSRSDSFACKNP